MIPAWEAAMSDIMTPEQRSERMGRVRQKHTKPESRVRSLLHRMGYRFRLHSAKLPGRPDIVLPRHRKIVLVHGCFWHRHDCRRALPATNPEFWRDKLKVNVQRDRRTVAALEALGWSVLVVWECETRDEATMRRALTGFLC